VYFVALAAARSVEFLHSSILETLVNQAQLQAENWEQLLHHLRNKKLLLVLDNFEHLMGAADALSQLMTAAPGIKLLVTSRERLNLLEEWVFELDGLEYPVMTTLDTTVGAGYGEMEHRLDDAPLEAYSAVRLFIQSARRLRAGLELLEGDLLAIVRICRLVDGMPLGIELAAAWAQMLSVQEIAREVQRSIDFLSTSVRNVPERHRSIRAVFEHSWQSLTLLEQGCLSQLSIFHGAFQLEGAQAVAGASLYMLLALVNKSLLRRNQDGGFEIHELLRQFAESKLNEAAHLELADRHAVYFSGYAANLLDAIISPREKAALDALQAEMDDIRGAWKHAAERRRWELIGQMYLPLIHFAMSRYRIPDLRELVQIALQVLGESPSTPQERLMTGKLLALEAWYTVGTHGIETALRSADRAHTLLEPFQDRLEVAPVLVWIGHLRDRPEHFHASSEQLMQRGIALAEAHGDAWMTAYGKLMLGWRFQNKRRYGEAQVLFHQALQQMRAIGQPTGIYQALQGLDENYRTLGDMDTAYAILDELVEIAEQLGNSILIAYSKGQRDLARNATFATDLWKHTLHAARTSGDTATVAWNLYHGGWLEMTDHLFEASEAHLTEALGLFRALGDVEGESWANLFLGQLALARAEYSGESGNQQRDPQVIAIGVQQARDYAQAAMVRVAQIDFPWPLADAHYLLGSAALAEGNRALALVEYRAALQLARDLQSLIQIIRHLSGFVGLMICEEEYELALLLAAFILQHPISPLDARRSAERHMAHLRQSLSADQVRQAEEQARTLTLEAAGLLALDWQP
jgi:predicted ATPase